MGSDSGSIPEVILAMVIDCQNTFPERRSSTAEICNILEDLNRQKGRKGLGLVPINGESLKMLELEGGPAQSGSSGGEIPN